MIAGTPSVPPEPEWLTEIPFEEQPAPFVDDAVTFADALEQEWDEHTQSRDEDEPTADELPGGRTFERLYAEAERAAGRHWLGLTVDERVAKVTLAARQANGRASAKAPAPGLTVLTWPDLLAEPPEPPPTIRPGIPKVGLVVVAGSPKIGKTLWVSQLALETKLPALLVVEEGSRTGIAYRLRKQAFHLELDGPPLTVMHRQRIRLDDRESVKRLRAYIEATRPAIIGLDPLNRLHTADENKPSVMTPVMDSMANIAYDFECAVVAVHHMAKPSADRRGDIWDRFRGASSIRSGTDANLVLDGSTDRVHLVGEFRDGEPMSEWLELDRETLLFTAGEPPEPPTKVDPLELRAFVEERGQVTGKLVAERFKVAKTTALTAIRNLGCDEYAGPRGVLIFTLATVQ